ncbi:MAG: hypothetical protein IJR74_05815 [Paludibacteraceae bacterium]|nr:hypothetical protein [Paludibacteraceae bacterium]
MDIKTLKDTLQAITLDSHDVHVLTKQFEELAPSFLYGGYISILNRFRVYLQRVEFYFHSEKAVGIQDKIVYHRDHYAVEGKLPYFTPITFHAHASGFDIAFENPTEQYRASALIRAYEIYDEQERQYLKVFDSKFVYCDVPFINTQSTYLYSILNGFGDAGEIKWVDEPRPIENIKQGTRKGVYVGTKWSDEQYAEPRARKWSFERITN